MSLNDPLHETQYIFRIFLFLSQVLRPVLFVNLFQLHEDSHDRRGRAASHYHYLIIHLKLCSISGCSKSCNIYVAS